jgi:ArsR family transcriptional regulator
VKNKPTLQELCQLFHVLADPTRLRLVMTLMTKGELHVSDLCGKLRLPQPTVSHHLGLLRAAGLVRNRRNGKLVLYSIHPARFKGDLRAVGRLLSRR